MGEKIYKEVYGQELLWGFKVTVMRDDSPVCDIGFQFDDGVQIKHQYFAKDSEGMPKPAGRKEEIQGKKLEVKKLDDNPVTEEDKAAIKRLCVSFGEAMNAYYSFGSVHGEDI